MARGSTSTSSKPKKHSRKRESTSKEASCLDPVCEDSWNDLGILSSSREYAIYRSHCACCKCRARRRHHPTSAYSSVPPPLSYLHRPLTHNDFRPHPEPHPRACPSHPPCRIKSVFMKKEMARLKDSAPDLPHRERSVRTCDVLVFLFRHIRRLLAGQVNC